VGVYQNQMNGRVQRFALIAQLARNKMEKTLDKLIITAKIIALYDLKEKITKEIEDLENQKEDDEIPF
jgi:hypothetical protein